LKTTRLEFFSDGVFAIVITLLVIDIRLPEGRFDPLLPTLIGLWPSYLAFALSFFVIGAIWINHHGMFQHIESTDNSFLLLNLLQLMAIAFIPFPTGVLAEAIAKGSGMPIAAAFYGSTLVLVGIFVNAMWRYAASYDLVKSSLGDTKANLLRRRFLLGPVAYAIATLIALVQPWAALAIFVGLNVFYLWPRWKRKPRPR
jgi:uncharacterized membrane protein